MRSLAVPTPAKWVRNAGDTISQYTDPDLAARTTTMLTTYSLVSGLLTTSTYQAFYAEFASGHKVDNNAASEAAQDIQSLLLSRFPGMDQGVGVDTNVRDIFRLLNGASFVLSLGCILVSTGSILILNTVVPGARAQRFTRAAVVYIYIGLQLSSFLLISSIVAGVAALAFGAFAFFNTLQCTRLAGATAIISLSTLLFIVGYYVLIMWPPVRDDRSTGDDETLSLLALRVLQLLRKKLSEQGSLMDTTHEAVTYDDVEALLEQCRKDFRDFKPNSVMPSAFFTPWALASFLQSKGILFTQDLWTIGEAIDECVNYLNCTESVAFSRDPLLQEPPMLARDNVKGQLICVMPQTGRCTSKWPTLP